MLGLAPKIIPFIIHGQANEMVANNVLTKCNRSNRQRAQCIIKFLIQLVKHKGIYDESVPGASLGWHDLEDEMTWEKMRLGWAGYKHIILLSEAN